jgi:copper chaperone NosL
MRRACSVMLIAFFVLGMTGLVIGEDDIKQFPSCKNCGMSRDKFAYSRIVIQYPDSKVGLCSIHCAAVYLRGVVERSPTGIFVGDYKSRDLIDALNACWVIGGSKKGVMTQRAKWAFKANEDAQAFIKEFGATLATYDGAMRAAYEDIRH